jgi:replicative DNA helicase
MRETHGIQFLVVDYLQLLSGSGTNRTSENRQNEISEISRMLKNLARELNIPVLCLSQLSRKVEERPGHRPMMSDLRESGCLSGDSLIQNADTGAFHTIQELANRKEQTPFPVYAVDKNLQIGTYQMTKAFYSGKKMLYELKTKTGLSIQASANHPFLTQEGWTRLDALQVSTKIGIKQNHATFWDEVLSITELKEQDVYDATVEEVHNFVANNIIVHNSIEQDSDIVMFLLRREYYDPYDKPGLAEAIVAKNRHGGVGSVFLAFRKELAQFGNYSGSAENASQGPAEDAFAAFSP